MFKKKNQTPTHETTDSFQYQKKAWYWHLIYFDPVKFTSGLWDAFDAWRLSRKWVRWLWFLPPMVLLLGFSVLFLMGFTQGRDSLLVNYLEQAAVEAPIEEVTEGNSVTGDDTVRVSRYGDLLYRRILQLRENEKNARFYVAMQRGISGDSEEALGMMRELAPKGDKGFEPAHAWLAKDLMRRSTQGEKIDAKELEHHLAIASNWSKVDPTLPMIYAEILERQQKRELAIAIATKATERDPRLAVQLAEMCRRANLQRQAESASKQAIAFLEPILNTDEETEKDRVDLARAKSVINDIQGAASVLIQGLAKNPDSQLLRRMLSNLFLIEYRKSIRANQTGFQANLDLLDRAAKADPSNPLVGIEVAKLANFGTKADQAAMDAFRKQLATGKATALTHLLIANAYMGREETTKAVQHWELALFQNPNLLPALNNLAMAMIERDPPNFVKAQQYLDRAIAVSPADSEVIDSQGVLHLKAKRYNEAIASFERAIQISPKRIDSRQSLAEAYELAGMTEMAATARDEMIRVRAQVEAEAREAAEKRRQAAEEALKSVPTEESLESLSEESPQPTIESAEPVNEPSQADG